MRRLPADSTAIIRTCKQIYREARLKNLFLGVVAERGGGGGAGVPFGLLRSRLGPPEYNRVELTTFARQSRMGSKL